MPLIIIEGCDATGKTSLIKELASELNLPVIKSYKPPSEGDIKRFTYWASASPVTPILDRAPFISDLVYGPIIRGKTPCTLELTQELRTTAYLVHCSPPLSAIIRNLHNEKQMEGVDENLRGIYDAYESLMQILDADFIYDYTNPRAYKALVTQLTHYLERCK